MNDTYSTKTTNKGDDLIIGTACYPIHFLFEKNNVYKIY